MRLEFGMGVRAAAGALMLVAWAAVAQQAVQPAAQGDSQAPTNTTQDVQQATQQAGHDNAATLQEELKKLGAVAQSLERDLPNFTCKEAGLSQALEKGKVKEHMRFVANVRVQRSAVGRLDEELEVSEVNGKPEKGRFDPPYMVAGGFAESLMYFLPESQDCFAYTLRSGRIDFSPPPGAPERARCSGMGSPTGFALLDEAGNPTHLERTVPHKLAEQLHIVDSTASDFLQTEMGGKTYPLATRIVADQVKEDNVTLHFEATFAGCQLFKATSRILPGETVVPQP